MVNTNSECFVLGFIYFEDDTISTITLTDSQQKKIQGDFQESLSKADDGSDLSAAWEDVQVSSGDDTYYKIKLKENDRMMIKKFLGDELYELVQEVQFSYYHHRAIFKFIFKSEAKFQEIRNRRGKIHDLIRKQCFDKFTNKLIDGVTIRYIYSYTLFIIPDGQNLFRKEAEDLKQISYDPIFSIRSTAFGFPLMENNVVSSLFGMLHYVRISVPGTIVYLKSKKLNTDLLSYIIDGIYYGGLYGKIKIDKQNEINGNPFKPENKWSHDLMIETYKVLKDTVSVQALSYVSNTIDRLSLIIAILAILIGLIGVVPLFKNDKVLPTQNTESLNKKINNSQ